MPLKLNFDSPRSDQHHELPIRTQNSHSDPNSRSKEKSNWFLDHTFSRSKKRRRKKTRQNNRSFSDLYRDQLCVTFDATLKRGVPFMRKEISTPFSNSRRTLFQFRGHRVSAFNEIPINRELAGKRTTQTSTGFVEYKEGHNFSRWRFR